MKSLRIISKTRSLSFILSILLLFSGQLIAQPVSIKHNGVKLNAEINPAEDKTKPFFLILHGTFAWHGMELPTSIQSLLEEEDYGSLAFSLSLGVNDRTGFFDCKQPIISKHGNAQQEIEQWVKYLNAQGYKNIVLVGHSRGGAQMAAYALANQKSAKQLFLIAPMTWKQSKIARAFNKNNNKSMEDLVAKIKSGKLSELKQQNILHCKEANIRAQSFLSYYTSSPEKNTPSLISETKMPTRIYLGSEDSITENIMKQKPLFEKNSNVSHLLIDGSDHFFRDFYADEMVTDMIETMQ